GVGRSTILCDSLDPLPCSDQARAMTDTQPARSERAAERESMPVDVAIAGAGAAGLAAAIRLKQLDPALEIVVLEKGSEVGAHVLSGAVIDPRALDELLPEWRDSCPLA